MCESVCVRVGGVLKKRNARVIMMPGLPGHVCAFELCRFYGRALPAYNEKLLRNVGVAFPVTLQGYNIILNENNTLVTMLARLAPLQIQLQSTNGEKETK